MVKALLEQQRSYFYTGATRPVAFRKAQLEKLKAMIVKHEAEIIDALKKDLNKPAFEAYTTEVGFVYESINYTLKNLDKWTKDVVVKSPIHQPFAKSLIKYEPYGVTLIIAPFNYPFQLLIEPLIGAIAAGNTAILKPSEYTTHTEKLIQKMFVETFDENYLKVMTGGREITSELIHAPFDYIFFTGSVPVGKLVMQAAAENLVPVTLELGGKSPTIVHYDADIKMAAKRIAWGKFMNAGQICIAPDYVYVHESVEKEFIDAVTEVVLKFYGPLPQKSPDYCRIVNEKHFDRLVGLINHEKVVMGGQYDRADRYIAPTVLKGVTWEDRVMSDEIFGPIMPIMTYRHVEDVIGAIRNRPKPLALYVFSESLKFQDHVFDELSFGGGCINDTILHVASPHLPFGGVGASGMGAYHSEESFRAFSHRKSVLKKTTGFDMKFLYPPYKNNLKLVKKILKQ